MLHVQCLQTFATFKEVPKAVKLGVGQRLIVGESSQGELSAGRFSHEHSTLPRLRLLFFQRRRRISRMDDRSIVGRTEKLRREIQMIQQEERRYRGQRSHSLAESAEHDKREFRVLAIREELKTLVEKAKQQSSHGSVWYG